MSKSSKPTDVQQRSRFIEAARELGCDEDESHFEEKLKKVLARKSPPSGALPKPREFEKKRTRPMSRVLSLGCNMTDREIMMAMFKAIDRLSR